MVRLLGGQERHLLDFTGRKNLCMHRVFTSFTTNKTSDGLNFETKLEDLQKILNSWKRRKVTLLGGKINVVKSLGLSKLIYNASTLLVPEAFSKQVDKVAFYFIWESKPHKIKKHMLIGDKKEGGLNMIEFDSMNKALKLRICFYLGKQTSQNNKKKTTC